MDNILQLPYEFAKQNNVMLSILEESITLHCFTMPSLSLLNEVRRFVSEDFEISLTSEENFLAMLKNHYEKDLSNKDSEDAWDELLTDMSNLEVSKNSTHRQSDLLSESDSPIVRYINLVLNNAISLRASDVHIEVFDSHLSVRARVDGVLRQINTPPKHLSTMLIARIKVMADLDIAEKRLPQDGRILLERAQRQIDVRVSIVPTAHGERAVLRILDQSSVNLELDKLGMHADTLDNFCTLLSKPHGIILVTGPTGSGKTTSLYAGLNKINETHRNILTVEDPVEYNLPGIGQIPVNTATNMTFAKGLRAILRQDPDVVMIGEIRDFETAQIAIQASLTGHLVLSTLHTNTAVGAATRLKDMGIQAYHLAESLTGLIAQRLLRKLCMSCRQPNFLTASCCDNLHLSVELIGTQVYTAVGCPECAETGYKGRVAVYELILVDKKIKELIYEEASEEELLHYARMHSKSILNDSVEKLFQGIVSVEEITRVISD
ncbi:MAG: Flp pilus assembly complex ATPase component TadA [Gammaproteobacteria bacterium]|nr:Flp pilus assembly complex ATPase component TadA [Gammaproteobacteria bacterium]